MWRRRDVAALSRTHELIRGDDNKAFLSPTLGPIHTYPDIFENAFFSV